MAAAIRSTAPGVELLIAPGNPGTAQLGRNVEVAADDIPALVALARAERAGLTIVGPEAPLAAGIGDAGQRDVDGPGAGQDEKGRENDGGHRDPRQEQAPADLPVIMVTAMPAR